MKKHSLQQTVPFIINPVTHIWVACCSPLATVLELSKFVVLHTWIWSSTQELVIMQDRCRCCSANKIVNGQSHQKPHVSYARRDSRRHAPPPPMERSQSLSADYKVATGPFHFCLDKAAVLNDFPRPAFVLDRTVSIWRKEASSFCVCVFRPPRPNRVYRTKSSASDEEIIDTAEKTITTTRYIANEDKIGNKRSLQWWVFGRLQIDCFADISSEEGDRRCSETRSRSNVSGAYILKETNVTKLVGTL